MKIRIGTRGSALAIRQTNIVIDALRNAIDTGARDEDVEVEIVKLQTKGDIRKNESLSEIGGKGLFVGEFEDALRDGIIDIAVHSGKDLPSKTPNEFCFATLERETPNDLLICREEKLLEEINVGLRSSELSSLDFVFGTASPRRELIMKSLFPRCNVKLLRGNIDTRLDKLRNGEYDAIVLAEAGVRRLSPEIGDLYTISLDVNQFVPASCQGIIACEAVRDTEVARLLEQIDHITTHEVFDAERAVMAKLGASCHYAAGVFCNYGDEGNMHIRGFYGKYDVKAASIDTGSLEGTIGRLKAIDEGLNEFVELIR